MPLIVRENQYFDPLEEEKDEEDDKAYVYHIKPHEEDWIKDVNDPKSNFKFKDRKINLSFMDEMATLTQIAYNMGEGHPQEAFEKMKKYPEWRMLGDDSRDNALVFRHRGDKNKYVIAYRGTNPKSIHHLLTDANMILGSKVDFSDLNARQREELGDNFRDYFDGIDKHFKGFYKKYGNDNPKISLTGHSLGGKAGMSVIKKHGDKIHDAHFFNIGGFAPIDMLWNEFSDKNDYTPKRVDWKEYIDMRPHRKYPAIMNKYKRTSNVIPKIYTRFNKYGVPDAIGSAGLTYIGDHIYVRDIGEGGIKSLAGNLINPRQLFGVSPAIDTLTGLHSLDAFATGRVKPYKGMNFDPMNVKELQREERESDDRFMKGLNALKGESAFSPYHEGHIRIRHYFHSKDREEKLKHLHKDDKSWGYSSADRELRDAYQKLVRFENREGGFPSDRDIMILVNKFGGDNMERKDKLRIIGKGESRKKDKLRFILEHPPRYKEKEGSRILQKDIDLEQHLFDRLYPEWEDDGSSTFGDDDEDIEFWKNYGKEDKPNTITDIAGNIIPTEDRNFYLNRIYNERKRTKRKRFRKNAGRKRTAKHHHFFRT